MRAIQYQRFGGYHELQLTDVPAPEAADGQAIVEMTVAGVSPLDDTARSGKLAADLHKPLPLTPGGSGVGRICEPGASGLVAGARVMIAGGGYGLRRDGTWSERLLAAPGHLLSIPDEIDDTAVAALSTGAGYLTAYLALTELVPFEPGQRVLAPGIGGSVGLGGVEVARVLGAAQAISTASRTDKAERGRRAGFEVIDLSQESLREGVDRLTGGRGMDVVLDGVAGPVTGSALSALAPSGTLVSIGYSGGTQTSVNVTDLIWKTARIQGFMFSLFTPATIAAANTTLLRLLARKEIRPIIARTFALAEAAEAQRYLIEDRPFGRVLLTL